MANIRFTFVQYSSSCDSRSNPEGFVECHSQRGRCSTSAHCASLLVQLFFNLFQTRQSCCVFEMVQSNPD